MSTDIKYWFATHNMAEIENKIQGILRSYSELSRTAMSISSVMSEYINVPEKWNDDNSVILAQWWNHAGSGAANGGDLKADPELGLTIVPSSTNGVYDGEDRIKGILNRSAYLFWVVICRPLYSVVSNQYEAARGSFSSLMNRCYEMGKSTIDDGNFTTNTWINFIQGLSSDTTSAFKNTVLPTENAVGGSNDAQIANFMQNVTNKLQEFANTLNTFVATIKPIMEDTPYTNQYFGFSPNSSAEQARSDLIRISNTHLEDFKKNLSEAVSTYSGDVSSQISKYLSTTYNIK